MNRKFFFLVAVACLCGGGGYKAQAQMIINVYPSQDSTNQTLWIFSGSSSATGSTSIRTGPGNNDLQNYDSWWFGSPNNGNIFQANGPNNQNISLSSLFSSSNSKDIASVNARIPGGGKTNITFAASATNTPTITVGSGSRTISHLFMQDDTSLDEMGIRVSGSALSHSFGDSSAWTGAGIINKPIGDFFAGNYDLHSGSRPNFATSNGVQVRVNSQIIPEPEEYALVFGLFALGFVLFRRYWQKKRQQQAAAIGS